MSTTKMMMPSWHKNTSKKKEREKKKNKKDLGDEMVRNC